MTRSSERALSDLQIIDLSQGVAGAFCSKLFADFGAKVIKVEPPNGDPMRRLGPFRDGSLSPDGGGLFLHLNTNKKSLTLDISSETGRHLFKRLLAQADVLIESFAPGQMDSWGLGYGSIGEEFPDLIYASVTPFGQSGPYKSYKGDNIAAQALCSYAYTTGDPEKEPLATNANLADYFAGAHLYVAILAAIAYRNTYGGGQYIDLSVFESITMADDYNYSSYAATGAIRRRYYSRLLMSYPNDIFPCKDGYISFVPGRADFPTMVAILMERPELMEHPLFVKATERVFSWREFNELVMPWFQSHSKEEILERAQELRLAFAPTPDSKELLEDKHLRERNYFVAIDHPEVGCLEVTGAPFRMSETPFVAGRAPLLGEHEGELLVDELGLTQEELKVLHAQGII